MTNGTVERTIQIKLTASELAVQFCNMTSDEQAFFFAEVSEIAREWPAGFGVQACAIADALDYSGAAVIQDIAFHIEKAPEA